MRGVVFAQLRPSNSSIPSEAESGGDRFWPDTHPTTRHFPPQPAGETKGRCNSCINRVCVSLCSNGIVGKALPSPQQYSQSLASLFAGGFPDANSQIVVVRDATAAAETLSNSAELWRKRRTGARGRPRLISKTPAQDMAPSILTNLGCAGGAAVITVTFIHPIDTVKTCVEIKILRRVRAEASRRPPRHRRDACSMAWRCRFLAARPSHDGRVIAEK